MLPSFYIHTESAVNFPCNVSDMARYPTLAENTPGGRIYPLALTRANIHLEISYRTMVLFFDVDRHFRSPEFKGFATPAGFHWTEGEIINNQSAGVTQFGGVMTVLHDKNNGKLLGINFSAHFQNAGGPQIGHFNGWISTHYFGDVIPTNFDLTQPYNKTNISSQIIKSFTTLDLGPATIPAEDAAKLLARKGMALVWGRAEYSDIFEPNKMHAISFCLLADMTPGVHDESGLRMTLYRSDCNTNQ